MVDGVSSEPVIAPLPTPISVEPRTAAPAEVAEIARQAEEAKVAAGRSKDEPAAKAVAKDEPKKPLSTREALRAAREKVNAEPVAEKASPLKAAEPAPAAAKEPVAAKDAPKAVEPAAKDAPARAEDGKFVSAKPVEPAAKDAPAAKAAEPVKEPAAPKLPSHTAEPPPARFSAVAKEKWAEAPDEVRAEVTRAVTELTKGFEKHRAAAERDAEIGEFHEMATRGGTTVKEALSGYVEMENALRNEATRDKGFDALFQKLGISPRDWAAKILNQAPDAVASKTDATIAELRNEIAELKKGYGSISAERQQAKTDSTTETVTKFAADHPRFEELSEDIAFFLKTRTKDLAEAYSLAERLNPAPAAAAPAPAASSAPVVAEVPKPTLVAPAASSAPVDDRGQKSIAGAPSAGSDPVRKLPTSNSVKEAIRRAAAAAR